MEIPLKHTLEQLQPLNCSLERGYKTFGRGVVRDGWAVHSWQQFGALHQLSLHQQLL